MCLRFKEQGKIEGKTCPKLKVQLSYTLTGRLKWKTKNKMYGFLTLKIQNFKIANKTDSHIHNCKFQSLI